MTILDFITRADPVGIAIAAPERNPMTYEGLAALVEKTLRSLNGAGLGRTDKLAIVRSLFTNGRNATHDNIIY